MNANGNSKLDNVVEKLDSDPDVSGVLVVSPLVDGKVTGVGQEYHESHDLLPQFAYVLVAVPFDSERFGDGLTIVRE